MSKKLVYLISFVLLLGVAGNASAWLNQDIGSPYRSGSASYDSSTGTWIIKGDGGDIWGTWDQFHYVYCPLSGDGVITARIVSMDVTAGLARAGVMIRETLDAGSKHAMMAMTETGSVQMRWRENTGAGSSSSTTTGTTPPWWLRIVRTGDQLSGYHSDGTTWVLQNTVTIPMDPNVYIGMAVTASNQLCPAVFDNVTATADCTAASNPSPPDGATCVPLDVVLSWWPGCLAESHNVYFGTDPDALPLVTTKPLGDETYAPESLEICTTYYWRVDEVCGIDVCEGEVWSFSTCLPCCGRGVQDYKDDIKWSQPPVEVNEGIINGWDEVSALGFSFDCWACPTQCHGDADCLKQGPFQVSLNDLNILTDAMGTKYGDPDYNPCADFNRDWKVDEADEVILRMWINKLPIPPADCRPELGRVIADDWVCSDDRPIKGIHWWGSFKGWTEPNCAPPPEMPDAFHIGIWTDVPDPNPCDPYTFSHPGELVWEKTCDCYVWSFAGYDLDPRGIDGNDACFKFDQLLSQDEWFYQDPNGGDGTVYWLSIAAICDGNTPEYLWGWKTRPHFCKDDAVRIHTLDGGEWPPVIGSAWGGGEPIQYPEGTSWDMAFVLTTNRKYTPRKWWWPDEEAGAADIYPDGRINFKDLAVIAEHWLEEAEWYPCDDDC